MFVLFRLVKKSSTSAEVLQPAASIISRALHRLVILIKRRDETVTKSCSKTVLLLLSLLIVCFSCSGSRNGTL